MAIIQLPDDMRPYETVQCTFCLRSLDLDEATVGVSDALGQAFACDEHFQDGNLTIVGWADRAIQNASQLVAIDFMREFQEDPHVFGLS